MKTKLQTSLIFLFVLSLSIFSCNLAGPAPLMPSATPIPPPSATPTLTPPPTDTPMPTPSPTDAPTPTPSQPVFDLAALGDNHELASFILTYKYKSTGGGEVTEYQSTIEYVKEPFGIYIFNNKGRDYQDKTYWIGDRTYKQNGMGDWTIDPAPDPGSLQLLQTAADMRQNAGIGDLKSARFVGQKDFNGVPANHFEFDQTDFTAYGVPGDRGYKIDKAQGDFYLAQDGNYVLGFHSKVSGNVYPNPKDLGYMPGAEEITKELSSINQVKEIVLPADYLALKLELELGLPLPPDTKFATLDHFPPLRGGGDIYNYKTSVSNAEFLQFYKDLAPTNGWTVSQVGVQIAKYEACYSRGCVVLKKGHAEMVLHREVSPFDGSITIIGYYAK